MVSRVDQDREAPAEHRHLVMRVVVFAVVAAVAAAFVLDNTDDINIGYVFGDKAIPLILVLVGAMIVGAVLDRLGTWIGRRTRLRP